MLVGRNDVDVDVGGESQQVVSHGRSQQLVQSSTVGVANDDMRHVLLMRDPQ